MNEPPCSRRASAVATNAVAIALLALPAVSSLAQQATEPSTTQATAVTAAEVERLFSIIGDSIDLQARVVDAGDETNVAVGVLLRRATSTEGEAVRGLVHHDVTEVYYVLEGSGTLVTGGTLDEPREFPSDSAVVRELVGPSRSVVSRGGASRLISKGDIVVIPAGVFHAFREIDDEIRYLSIRVDPRQKLPAGYVHPALKE